MSDSLWPHGLYSPWNSLGQNTGVGTLSLLQGIFPMQRLNPGLPYCRQILYQLSHKGSTHIYINIWYLIFSDLLHSAWHTLGPSTSQQMTQFCFFSWLIFYCIYIPHHHYPFFSWWTFRLLPHPGYCKQYLNELWGTCVFLNYGFLLERVWRKGNSFALLVRICNLFSHQLNSCALYMSSMSLCQCFWTYNICFIRYPCRLLWPLFQVFCHVLP